MNRILACLAVLSLLVAASPVAAEEADMAGGWMVEFALPWGGTASYPMWVNQDGTRLTGRVTIVGVAEYQLKGTIKGDQFTIVWQSVVNGEFSDITFAGRVKGDELSGTATVGKYEPRELYGRRTER